MDLQERLLGQIFQLGPKGKPSPPQHAPDPRHEHLVKTLERFDLARLVADHEGSQRIGPGLLSLFLCRIVHQGVILALVELGRAGATMCSAMQDRTRYKVAFIGSHGVGKTTLCFGLAARLKARDVTLEVVREVARSSPLPINESTSIAAQSWILHTQIAEELVAESHYGVVICDRIVLDNYVYLLVAAGPQSALEPIVEHWMKTYDLLLHVPIVDALSADGIRATDPAFQKAVDDRLRDELERRGRPVHRLDPRQRDRWIDDAEALVCEQLAPPQLQLL